MRKVTLLFVAITMIASHTLTAQVAINTDGTDPDSSAILDLKSTNSGLLLPRLNTLQISGISNPAAGLMVFNTDSSDFYGFNGSKWISVWNTGDTLADWYCGNPITDSRDGQTYTTIQIGTQCWMSENLAATKYNDGTDIPLVTDNSAWASLTTPAYCWYNNDSATYASTYGALYNWYSADTSILCPTGWHVPSDGEWKTMEMALGMSQSQANVTGWRGTTDEGEKMKSTSGWNNNGNGTNSSGFNALPGGFRGGGGPYSNLGNGGIWWSSSEGSGTAAWYRSLLYGTNLVGRYNVNKAYGYSVCCLKN